MHHALLIGFHRVFLPCIDSKLFKPLPPLEGPLYLGGRINFPFDFGFKNDIFLLNLLLKPLVFPFNGPLLHHNFIFLLLFGIFNDQFLMQNNLVFASAQESPETCLDFNN